MTYRVLDALIGSHTSFPPGHPLRNQLGWMLRPLIGSPQILVQSTMRKCYLLVGAAAEGQLARHGWQDTFNNFHGIASGVKTPKGI